MIIKWAKVFVLFLSSSSFDWPRGRLKKNQSNTFVAPNNSIENMANYLNKPASPFYAVGISPPRDSLFFIVSVSVVGDQQRRRRRWWWKIASIYELLWCRRGLFLFIFPWVKFNSLLSRKRHWDVPPFYSWSVHMGKFNKLESQAVSDTKYSLNGI